MEEWDQYTWVFAISTVVSFVCAFGIGANDVANSFASSVGAKAITIGQACLLGGVLEFAGAMSLGASVTATVKGGVANTSAFKETPDLLMYGFMCVLFAAAFWDNYACQLELPVSTTHTIVGSIVGMAIVIRGSDAVIWFESKDEFPYIAGLTSVLLSWVVSPISSGILVFLIFGFIRTFVLRSEHSFIRGSYLLPVLVSITFFIIIVFIIQVGSKNNRWDGKISDGKTSWIAAACAVPMGILTLVFIVPLLKKWVEMEDMTRAKEMEEGAELDGEGYESTVEGMKDVDLCRNDGWWSRGTTAIDEWADKTAAGRLLLRNPVANFFTYGVRADVHDAVVTDAATAAVWENAEVFDHKTERLFRYLQVFSAMVVSFSHGANDTANAVGPYAAIYSIWRERTVPGSKSPVPEWIYALGGIGISVGLALFGFKILRILGVKVAKLTHTRGFASELSTAIVVLVASRYGLPVSTTQIATGSILAIGLFEGMKGVNWFVVIRTFGGWVLTLIVAGGVAASLTAFGLYGPSKVATDNIVSINKVYFAEIDAMRKQLDQFQAANLGTGNFSSALDSTLRAISKNLTALQKGNAGTINPIEVASLTSFTVNIFNESLVQ